MRSPDFPTSNVKELSGKLSFNDVPYSGEDVKNIMSGIEIDRSEFFRKPGDIEKYRLYARGEQPKTLTTAQQKFLEGLLINDYCDNVCHQIVAEDADRVQLKRYEVPDADVKSFLENDLWVKNTMDDFTNETHYACFRDGDYAIMVDYDVDQERVRLYKEPWWNGVTGVWICYDAQETVLYAVKEWDSLEGKRRIVWYSNRIERYVEGGGGAWLPFALPSDDQWPLPWLKQDGSDLHVPLIHFPNAGRSMKNYGSSELAGGILAAQDQINDIQYDLSGAGRLTAFQMLTATGVKFPKDSYGNMVTPEVGPAKVWHTENPEGKFGSIPAGDIGQLISLYMLKLKAVSRASRTPLHLITGGDWPSGDALMRAEAPLINKATKQIAKLKSAWATVAHRATEIYNTFAQDEDDYGELDETSLIIPIFAPPDMRDPLKIAMTDLTFWQAAQAAVTAGLPLKVYLAMMGWSEQQLKNVPSTPMNTLGPTHPTAIKDVVGAEAEAEAEAQPSSPDNTNQNPPPGSSQPPADEKIGQKSAS